MQATLDDVPFICTRSWMATFQREALRGDAYGDMLAGHCRLLGLEEMLLLPVAEEDTRVNEVQECWQPFVDLMAARIVDTDPAWAMKVMAHHRRSKDSDFELSRLAIDPVTSGWLERRGMSASTLSLLPDFFESPVLEPAGTNHDNRGDIGVDVAEYDLDNGSTLPVLDLGFRLEGTDYYWGPGRIGFVVPPCETVRIAAIGRRLVDVLSHPLLDPHDLVISEWDDEDLHVELSGLRNAHTGHPWWMPC